MGPPSWLRVSVHYSYMETFILWVNSRGGGRGYESLILLNNWWRSRALWQTIIDSRVRRTQHSLSVTITPPDSCRVFRKKMYFFVHSTFKLNALRVNSHSSYWLVVSWTPIATAKCCCCLLFCVFSCTHWYGSFYTVSLSISLSVLSIILYWYIYLCMSDCLSIALYVSRILPRCSDSTPLQSESWNKINQSLFVNYIIFFKNS